MRPREPVSVLLLTIQLTVFSGCNESPPTVEDEGPPPTPVCGDGIQAADELCDDGNLTPGDGCSAECVPSGTPLDCATLYDGYWDDRVNAVVGLPDGGVVAGGHSKFENSRQGWVSRYTPDGEVSWTSQIDLGDSGSSGSSDVLGLVDDGELGVWALTKQSSPIILVHFDADGVLTDSVEVSVAFGELVNSLVLARFDGDLWIGGSDPPDDAWLGRYNPTSGEATTVLREDYLGYRDQVTALAPNGDHLLVAATMSASPNFEGDAILVAQTDVLLITLDNQGSETNRVTVTNPDEEYAPRADAIAVDSLGRVYVGGTHVPINTTITGRTWVAALSPDGGDLWSWSSGSLFDGRAGFGFGDIAAVDDAILISFAAHDLDGENNHGQGWTTRILDGEAYWHHAMTSDDYQHYYNQQILVRGADQPRIVSKAWTQDESSVFELCTIAW